MNKHGIYEKNSRPELDAALFCSPTSEYRGAPFWAWNCALDDETLKEQIDVFQQMGMGGFHIHVRTGMDSPYLTDEYMDHVKVCLEQARRNDMLLWLYDEDRWPSGTAGGIVTENLDYAMRYLLFTSVPYGQYRGKLGFRLDESNGHDPVRAENGRLLAAYDVLLRPDGTLQSYRMIDEETPAEGTKWYAYLERVCPSAWVNNHPYVDTLNPEAVRAFVRTTHERYDEAVGDEFGRRIPAIFTDEPQYAQKFTFSFPEEKKDLYIPWTEGFPEFFRETQGCDILPALPELFWERAGGVSQMRWRYHDAVTERFVTAYCDTLGNWCRDHGIMLGGHVMLEPTLETQTGAVGEAMRCYRAFGDMPGIDMLCDFHEYNTAKQAQSALHQQGGTAMLSELYGVTGWDYDFRGHKLQGDWQAALGVTVRVPHLTWMSMAGEAKRDYPACIGYQSPWYRRYGLIETHFARLNTALTRGNAVVRVAVVHPIESYWLHWGPGRQTAAVRDELEQNFAVLTEILLFGMIDFDFICESRLPDLCPEGGSPLRVGAMAYDTILVPGCHTLRSSTLRRLEAFRAAGGRLIFLGKPPDYVDACPSEGARALFDASERLDFGPAAILEALEAERFVDVRDEKGVRSQRLIHQLRRDGRHLWLFLANGRNPDSPDVDPAPLLRIELRGEYTVMLWDTLTGETAPLDAAHEAGNTVLWRRWHLHDSLLLRLTPGRTGAHEETSRDGAPYAPVRLPKRVAAALDEPNMLLLDSAEYAVDDGPWQPEDDILRLDNACRAQLNMPPRKKYIVQPYLLEKRPCEHVVRLRMRFDSEVAVDGAKLALERAGQSDIRLNGRPVPAAPDGWYVDKAIKTVPLPGISVGENILEISQPIGERDGIEFFYLLGDFGVRVEGDCKTVTAPVRRLAFGDVTVQGLPFYTGNITYQVELDCQGERLCVRVPQYRGALVEVLVDGVPAGDIVFSPYRLEVGGLAPGRHTLGLKLYGTRQNGFGQLHHTGGIYFYQSADSWRSTGDLWTEQYQLKPVGILKTSQIGV